MFILADASPVDWTAIIQTFGVCLTGVATVVGGLYMRVLQQRQAHEAEMEKNRIAAKAAEAERLEAARLHNEEVEDRKRVAEEKRERGTGKEAQKVIDLLTEQNQTSRKEIHSLRGDLQTLTSRVAVCEAQRQEQEKQIAQLVKENDGKTKQLKRLYELLDVPVPEDQDDSKVHRTLSALQDKIKKRGDDGQ